MDAQEKKWRAESDARALVEAEEVKADKGRLTAAKKQLQRQVRDTTTAAERVGVRLKNLKPKK